jgi:hypothetical protein
MEEKKLEKIKAIVKTKPYLFFFEKIDKIYFDTYGEYSFLKEAEEKCNWEVDINNDENNSYRRIILIKRGIYSFKYSVYFGISNKYLQLMQNKKIVFYLTRISKNVYSIQFSKDIFTFDDAMFISDKIIRELYIISTLN